MSLKTSFYLSIRNQDYLQRLYNRQLLSLVIESYSSPLIGIYKKKVELETGIPQGSPISPILFLLYIRNIYSIQTEGAYSLSYIDDFIIIVTLNLAKSNYKRLERIALELMSKAKEAAISFDVSKTELIYFYSKRTIEEGLKLGDVEISPKPLVRWLGVFLDSKLTFK